MLTRIIVALVGIPLLLAVMFLLPPYALGIVCGGVSAIAAFELMRCAMPGFKTRLAFYASISAMAIAVMSGVNIDAMHSWAVPLVFLLVAVIFAEMIASYGKKGALNITDVSVFLMASFILPMLLSSLVRVNRQSIYWGLAVLIVTFSSDSGAYFCGTFFGKRKLCPNISPKKTVEGAVGGLVCSVVLMLAYGFVLGRMGENVSYPALFFCGSLGSVACQVGDLSFSVIKRQAGIKDYGNLLPGHGGMLDRFDSMHFTAPMIELLIILSQV